MARARHAATWVPERAEIIFIQFNPRAGKEMPDEHPLLVVSAQVFTERTGLVFGFPMTHSAFHADNPFAIVTQGVKGEASYVLVHQPKSLDWRARGARPHAMGRGHTKLLLAVLRRFDTIFRVCEQT